MEQSQAIQDLQQQLQLQQQQNRAQKELIDVLCANTDQLQTQLFKKDKQLVSSGEQLASRDVQLAVQKKPTCQQEIPQLRQQLQSFEQKMDMMEKRIQELQQQLSQRGSQKEEEEASGEAASGDGIELRWKDGCRAPVEMYGEEAASAVNGSVAYFLPGGSEECTVRVLAYDAVKDDWYKLPKCRKCDFSLAVVNNLLTAIGGKKPEYGHTTYTNSLLSLTDHDKKWTKHFPKMPTKRSFPAVVCSGKYLVVAGGERQSPNNVVEVLDTKAPYQWSTASSLPHPLSQATATLCGDQIYVVGGFDQDEATSRSVFACSMAILFQFNGEVVWHSLAGVPATQSTYASLNGRLLAVGGKDSSKSRKSAIHAYNTTTNSWEVIGHMPTPCSQCRVAVLPQNKLMVVGGRTQDGPTYFVKIATIV